MISQSNDTPTFQEWLDKYFKDPVRRTTYRSKYNDTLYTEAELARKWNRAYNTTPTDTIPQAD